jgi:multiple sugar transport system substrate-binding protein
VNTAEAKNAVETITQLFDNELANPKLNYADSEKGFLNGDAAILVNGTWVVDALHRPGGEEETALDNYYVADFPTLFGQGATWADSHMWAIPASVKTGSRRDYKAALGFLAFLNDHNVDWARTGHMAVRNIGSQQRRLRRAAASR